MAELPVITGISRVCLRWSRLDACNVLHFRQTTTDQDGLYSSISAHVTAAMWTPLPNSWSISLVEITPLDGSTATKIYVTGSTSKWSGTASTLESIPAAAPVISLRTAKRGKSYRGRVFLPAMSEGAQDSGIMSTGNVTALASAWGTFITDMQVASSPLVVASYKLELATNVTSCLVRSQYGIQRRRQERVA